MRLWHNDFYTPSSAVFHEAVFLTVKHTAYNYTAYYCRFSKKIEVEIGDRKPAVLCFTRVPQLAHGCDMMEQND